MFCTRHGPSVHVKACVPRSQGSGWFGFPYPQGTNRAGAGRRSWGRVRGRPPAGRGLAAFECGHGGGGVVQGGLETACTFHTTGLEPWVSVDASICQYPMIALLASEGGRGSPAWCSAASQSPAWLHTSVPERRVHVPQLSAESLCLPSWPRRADAAGPARCSAASMSPAGLHATALEPRV